MEQFDIDFGSETDLEPKSIRVRIGNGRYVVREALGAQAKQYKNACMAAARMDDGKIIGMSGLASAEYLLVSLCTKEVITLGDGSTQERPVSQTLVEGWKNKVSKKLYTWIKDNSELNEADTEEALTKEIAKLQERLNKLRQSGPFPGGRPTNGTDGSGSPMSLEDPSTNS